MRNITILLLSDIHLLVNNEPEGQGLVVGEFFKDLDLTLKDIPFEDRFCIISGDLVQIGGLKDSYIAFATRFLSPLTKYVSLKNILCIPGNHDLNRNHVENHREVYEKWITSEEDETKFNAGIKDDEYFKKLFECFTNFRDNCLIAEGQNIFGFSRNFLSEISVMCLNTALLSNGGLDEKNINPPFKKDLQNLRIETSALYNWSENNVGRTKILVMHHPVNHLTEYAQHQLEAIINKSVDVLISGHIHFQKYEAKRYKGRLIHIMTSPQLYSNKKDINAYSLLHFCGKNLSKIEYRQWSAKNQHFMIGAELADNDTGVVDAESPVEIQNVINLLLKNKFEEAMFLYNYPVPWCSRFLSTSLSPTNKMDDIIDYISILNCDSNYQIIAPPQFGLTSYARYLALKADEIKGEKWVYLDMDDKCNHANIENKLRYACQEVGFGISEAKCVLLDNWNGRMKDRQKIIDKINKTIPDVRIILFSNLADGDVLAGIDTEESHKGFKLYYLRELSRPAVRTLVEAFNESYNICDTDFLLDRLLIDIESLNEHRTPLNCLQLLMAYRSDFEAHPVNRSRVLELVLDILFKNSNTLFYNGALNEKDCCNIMGVIAYELFKQSADFFTWNQYKTAVMRELPLKYTEEQIKDLLQILVSSQVLEKEDGGFRFHFVYWVYYFVAYRMYASDQCFEEMMVHNKHYFNADIVEFYTAINDKSDKMVQIIVNKLSELIQLVSVNVGRPFWNPYDSIKWNQNEVTKGKTTEMVEEEIKASRLPDDIKDAIKDSSYDSLKPYNQPIQRMFDEYEVSNLMHLTRSASRALRNCHLVDDNLLITMRDSIYAAWIEIFKVLILITPALANTGYGGYGGARFKLEGDFSNKFNECVKQIICAIPFNIVNWYKEDFFSENRVMMYKDAMQNAENPIVRHLNARVITMCRPVNWRDMVNSYIASVGKNTFFLGDINDALRHCYRFDPMTDEDLRVTRNLILTCYTKHRDGGTLPSLDSSVKNADKVELPKRLTD